VSKRVNLAGKCSANTNDSHRHSEQMLERKAVVLAA
jgi:hypothetical protein